MIFGGYTLIAMFYALLLLASLIVIKGPFQLLYWKPLRTLGNISYGVYLFHQIVFGLVLALMVGSHVTTAQAFFIILLSSVATVAFAHFSYSYFEHRLIELGHRFRFKT